MTIRQVLLICALTGSLPSDNQAYAEEPSLFYWRGGLGYVQMVDAHWKDPYAEGDLSYDGGPGLSLAVGSDFGGLPLRLELEGLYQSNDIGKISSRRPVIEPADWARASLSALMANGYVDFKNQSKLTPYLTGGVGCGWYSIVLEDDNSGTSHSIMVYQFGAGITYDVQHIVPGHYGILIDIGYRYVGSTDPEIDEALGGTYETEYASHALMLSVLF